MSALNIVEQAQASTKGKSRTSYGIVITVGKSTLNEWGLSENEAKTVHELLTLNGDKPLPPTSDGIVYSRRPPSNMAQELAALRTQLTAKS